MVQTVDTPAGGLDLVADPIRLDGSLAPIRRPPPRLGEHTEEVLAELNRAGETPA
jgi:crotonobetainyl-CoA:carnitine CoA-transferase CaiB-like acyl-CoA transferase